MDYVLLITVLASFRGVYLYSRGLWGSVLMDWMAYSGRQAPHQTWGWHFIITKNNLLHIIGMSLRWLWCSSYDSFINDTFPETTIYLIHPFAPGTKLFHNTTLKSLTLSSVLSGERQISPEPICRSRPFISILPSCITACHSPGQSWGRRAAYDPSPNQADEAPHLPSPPTSCKPCTLAELLHYQQCSPLKWWCHSPGPKKGQKMFNFWSLQLLIKPVNLVRVSMYALASLKLGFYFNPKWKWITFWPPASFQLNLPYCCTMHLDCSSNCSVEKLLHQLYMFPSLSKFRPVRVQNVCERMWGQFYIHQQSTM